METDERFEFVGSMTDDERGVFLKLSFFPRIIFASIIITIWMFGSLMKFVMFKYLNRVKIVERPINILIVISQTSDYILNTAIIIYFVIVAASGTSFVNFINDQFDADFSSYSFCWIYFYLTFFWISFYDYSGLGIAIFRLLLVKKSRFVKKRKRSIKLMIFILLVSAIVSSFATFLFGQGEVYGRAAYNSCQGTSENFQVFKY